MKILRVNSAAKPGASLSDMFSAAVTYFHRWFILIFICILAVRCQIENSPAVDWVENITITLYKKN